MKKHILFIVENQAVPHDRRTWLEAVAAKDWGFEVSVISRKEEKANLSYEKLDGIEIYRHPVLIDAKWKLAYVFEYAYALFWELLLALKIYIKKPFQIIHAGNPPDFIFLIALLFKIMGVKFVFDIHDLSPELYLVKFSGGKNNFYKLLVLAEKLSSRLADAIITTNMSYKRIVSYRHNKDEQKIFVVRNDPIVGEYLPIQEKCEDRVGDKKVILYLGSINPQDGVEILIRSLNYLVNDLNEKGFVCYIVGDGHSLPSLKRTVDELNLSEFVDFKGYVYERGKIKEYLDLADVCVEPAPDNVINRYSTFIKIMEYMASTKPIVAFDLLENRYSTDGSAILVTPGSIEEFAHAMKKLLHEPQLREKLGKAGLMRIRNELNWGNSLVNLREAYNSLSL